MKNSEKQTVWDALMLQFPESSKNTLRSWLKEGRILVDGQVVYQVNTPLNQGSKVELAQKKQYINHDLEILYADKDLIVIHKPEGLLSVATPYETSQSAHDFIKKHYPGRKIVPVHRLDKDTSGVMIFSLSDEATKHLKEQFEKHTIARVYLALVEGLVDEEEGTWDTFLYEDANYVVHISTFPSDQRAITHFRVQKRFKKTTLLELTLETGRKNQIRVHCQAAGHPVVGDSKYGSTASSRLMLHAYLLEFTHPISKKRLKFTVSAPKEFYAV